MLLYIFTYMHVYIINHFYTQYINSCGPKGAQESHPSFCELSSLTRHGSLVLQGTAEPEVDEHHGRCSLGAGVATLPVNGSIYIYKYINSIHRSHMFKERKERKEI